MTHEKRRLAILISALLLSVGLAGALWYATIAWVRSEERAAAATALVEANLAAEAVEQRDLANPQQAVDMDLVDFDRVFRWRI